MAYIIILPDPDWRHRCRHRGGDPDCSCFPECPECGTIYTPTDGHDCLDDVPADELLDAAKELRDSLDACETERDRLRAQIAALQAVPQGVEVPEPPESEMPHVSRSLHSGEGDFQRYRGFEECVEWARKNARLVPTPPQPLQSVPHGVELTEDDVRRALMSNAIDVDVEGVTPRLNRIIVSRLVPTTIKPLQPEERRMGPDEVAVSREEWEALNAFLEDWRAPESRSLHDWNTSLKAKAARINALRTSAQDHNGEGAK